MVVIGAIIIGVWAVIFLMGFSYGMVKSYINNAIENEISHIQIHHPDFPEDKEAKFYLEDQPALLQQLQQTEHVQAASTRTLVTAMLGAANGTRGVMARGIQPEAEAAVTKLDQKIVEGEYFSDKKNQILVSKALAEKIKVKLRSKVVLTFQDINGEITAAAFRIAGLFETSNSKVDEGNVYVQQSDLNRLIGKENIAHEAAIFLRDVDHLTAVASELRRQNPNMLVQTYSEISPDIQLMNSQMEISSMIFTVIVMLALIFGIINTMLMAVLERIKELGMLMSIGMNKVRVFFMIVLETIMLGLIAAPIGLALGYLTIEGLSKTGINMSAWSDGLKEFGMSELIYPSIENSLYVQLATAVVITAIVASLYPAYKAVSLRPVDAIRTL